MPARYVDITAADDRTFAAYVTQTPGHTVPGVVLIQEIFGINPVMREIAEHLASLGYMVACPDLFWRQEPGVEITDRSQAEWDKAFALYQGFDEATGVSDIAATVDFLRKQNGCTGKVGAIGYCLGGKLAYLTATRTDTDCAIGYYGVGIEKALDEAASITKPLMLHVAENDQFCPPDAQAAIAAGLKSHGAVTIHSYPGMDHAFARTAGEHYDATAANRADQRTADFLAAHLT